MTAVHRESLGDGPGTTTTCAHCGRAIHLDGDVWVDPEATGDDAVWRETCDSHDTFVADHEPKAALDDRAGMGGPGD